VAAQKQLESLQEELRTLSARHAKEVRREARDGGT